MLNHIHDIFISGAYHIRNLLSLSGGNVLDNSLIAHMRFVLSLMLNLFIISVGHLNCLIIGMLNSLVISYSFSNFHLITQSSHMGINILPLIRYLFMGNNRFIIGVIFLIRLILNPTLRLRCTQRLHDGLFQILDRYLNGNLLGYIGNLYLTSDE